MEMLGFLAIGLMLGAAVAYLWTRREVVQLEAEKKAQEAKHGELEEAFKGLSARALKENNEAFLGLAKNTFGHLQEQAKGDLGQRQQSIKEMVEPLQKTLDAFARRVQELEKEREGAYVGLTERIKHLAGAQMRLESETANLVKALRAPNVRGQWGEMQLKRTVELAGMVDHVDFNEQVVLDDGRQRPDMVVDLPNGRKVIVDAKAPLAAYLSALETEDIEAQKQHLDDHARQIRDHVTKLGSKAYWKQLEETPEFVVLFLPGETFFSAALERDPELLDFGAASQVILATPTTLIALLKAVAYGWRQESVAQEAKAIAEVGATLYERMAVLAGHIGDVGKGLEKSLSSYNKAVSSLEKRVLPAARKIHGMRAVNLKEIKEISPVEGTITEMRAEELSETG